MIPSAGNNEQQGDPNWATENWDHSGAVGGLDQASRQYSGANGSEWEWDPMILAQHHGSGGSIDGSDGDHKHKISVGTMSSLQAPRDMPSAGVPSNFAHSPMCIFSSAGIQNLGFLDGSGQPPITANLHSTLESSGKPGLAATNGTSLHSDIRSYDQRRCEFSAASMHDHHIKREKIVLNLGVRTYFSNQDAAVGRLSKRHRVGSPGSQLPTCQAEGCKADLNVTKNYYRRHKVCEFHSKTPIVIVGGHTQRFCQQCSRFHRLGEFDDGKRSCRKRLADHNRRRRKAQPNAPTSGGISAESTSAIKVGDDGELHTSFSRLNDPKSMLDMYLEKKCGCPSFLTLEDTNEKLDSAGYKLKLRTSDLDFCRSPRDDHRSSYPGMSMNSQLMTCSEAQASLSALSFSLPGPFPEHKPQRQLTMLAVTEEYDRGNSVYQHHMQGVGGSQSGPNLSLSSPRDQQGLQGRGRRRPMSGQSCNGTEHPVHWLRPINANSDNMTQVVSRQGAMRMQALLPTETKSGITSASANSSNSQEHDVEAFSPINQNLLPQGSSDLSSPDWMSVSMREAQTSRSDFSRFGPSTPMSNLLGSDQLQAVDQMLDLIGTSNQADANPGNDGCSQNVLARNAQMEYLQQKDTGTDSGGDDSSWGGSCTVDSPDLKYSDLQPLRPGSYGTPTYDSHQDLF
uniref:SBP-type domain-containing protein n=1 Tax=Physcomitrium patens TaxID=3218 RepID=A0A7I4DNY4_PHYPA|nr:uncharacterized protein LOC112280779 isoform X1 [Physcomitrium patens]|eukprot:XP_024372366.1 uncharacterized protein LOC112280779 isoform X1 [Physcomitrella patens]